jgi:hypothetical protein
MLSLMLLFACDTAGPSADTGGAVVDLTVSLAPPEQGLQVVTEPVVIEPYTEREICSVVRVEADQTLLWTDRMETLVSAGSHHMNVFMGEFSFLDPFLGDGAAEAALGVEVGQYDCGDLSMMGSAFPVFPSQRENQQITFPEGVAAPVMAPALVIFSHHYVNTRAEPVRINAALNIEAVPSEEVEHMASLVFDAIGGISVPPGEQQVVTRTCVMERDVEVALVSTHTHEWAECASLNDYDGAQVADEPFFVNKAWETPPILHFEPGSFSLSAGQGVHYACHYDNTTDRTLVNDGTSQGEMCVFAAVMYPATWSVQEVEETVASGDLAGLVTLMGEALGPCDTTVEVASPWDDGGSCDAYTQTEGNTLD